MEPAAVRGQERRSARQRGPPPPPSAPPHRHPPSLPSSSHHRPAARVCPPRSALLQRRNHEGAADILAPRLMIEPDLRSRRARCAQGDRAETVCPALAASRCARNADWLNRRRHNRQRCSGTGTTMSASASSCPPGPRHQPRHEQARFMPVAIFERMNEHSRAIIKGDRRARPVPRAADRPAPAALTGPGP